MFERILSTISQFCRPKIHREDSIPDGNQGNSNYNDRLAANQKFFEEAFDCLCDRARPWVLRDEACTDIAWRLVDGNLNDRRNSRHALFSLITKKREVEFHSCMDRIELLPKIYHRVLTLDSRLKPVVAEDLKSVMKNISSSLTAFQGILSAGAIIDIFSDAYTYGNQSMFLQAHSQGIRWILRSIKQNPDDPMARDFLEECIKIEPISKANVGIKTAEAMLLFNRRDEQRLKDDIKMLQLENIEFNPDRLSTLLHNQLIPHNKNKGLEVLQGAAVDRIGSYCKGELTEKMIGIYRPDNISEVNDGDVKDLVRMISYPLNTTIEQILDIDLKQLTEREQFYLLKILKEGSTNEVTVIADLLKNVGIEGAKCFLLLEYLGSETANLLSLLEHKDRSRNLIREFCLAIDALEEFKTKLENKISDSADKQLLPDGTLSHLHEGFLRRCCDLLLSTANGINTEQGEVIKIRQAEVALSGMRVLFEVLATGASSEKYKITRWDAEGRDSHADNLIFDVEDQKAGGSLRLKMLFRQRASSAGEARWNIELNFDRYTSRPDLQAAFKHTVGYIGPPRREKLSSTLRCGLDLSEAGSVSLDIGRSAFQGKNFSTDGCVIGKLMASSSIWKQDHHNSLSFPSWYSDPQIFEKVVRELRQFFVKLDS